MLRHQDRPRTVHAAYRLHRPDDPARRAAAREHRAALAGVPPGVTGHTQNPSPEVRERGFSLEHPLPHIGTEGPPTSVRLDMTQSSPLPFGPLDGRTA